MAQQHINLGTAPNDGTGDTLNVAIGKCESNFNDLYTSGFTTGDVKTTIKITADPGWVMMNDGTIGDLTSGGTTMADPLCEALFILIWTNISDANCPVSGGRGASAAADFAAHKRIALPKMLGRAMAGAGAGAGLTSRVLGASVGAETHQLTIAELAAHAHSVYDPTHVHGLSDPTHSHGVVDPTHGHSVYDPTHAHGVSDPTHAHTFAGGGAGGGPVFDVGGDYSQSHSTAAAATGISINGAYTGVSIYAAGTGIYLSAAATSMSMGGAATGISLYNEGGGIAHNNMQPTTFLNYMIKL